jgi:chemosensory pili system protein ChpA (sensor histidine kinase/response regulator)
VSEPLALIIEDEADLSEIFSQALRAAGFATQVARDGRQALERLATLVPDVVVLDLHLPHVDGDDLLHRIRADERLAGTQVIIASADPLMAETLDGLVELVLIKPVSFVQLRDLSQRLKLTIDAPPPP